MFKKKFFILHLTVSIILLLIIFFKDYSSQFNYNKLLLKYYYFIFLLLMISVIIFFLNDEFLKIYIISITTSIICLYTLEFYFYKKYQFKNELALKYAASYFHQKKHSPELVDKINYDNVNFLSKYLEIKKKYEIYPLISKTSIFDNNEEIYVLSSISNSKILVCNENGYYPISNTDRYGFINDNKLWSKDNPHLIIVGDSWMETACHSYEDGVAGQFKKKSKENYINLSPITLSHGNNGPLMQLGNIIEYIDQLSPKIVLWIYYDGNDLSDLNRELKNEILKKYLNTEGFSQNLAMKQNLIDRKLKSRFLKEDYLTKVYDIDNYHFKEFVKLSKLRDEISYAINYTLNDTKKNKLDNFNYFKEIIIKAKKITLSKKSDFYFVYLPKTWAIDNLSDINDTNYLKIKKFLMTENIKLIDFNEKLKSHPDPKSLMPFRADGHFNQLGVSFFAQEVLSELNYN